MERRTLLRAALAVALVPPCVFGLTSPGQAVEPTRFTLAQRLLPTSRVVAAKAATSRAAKSDELLIKRTDTEVVGIIVKLDYDSTATYAGGVAGFAATSPAVTGRPLTGGQAERRYVDHIVTREGSFLRQLAGKVKQAKVGQRLRTVYGGIALRVPANKVKLVAAIPGVVAVQSDAVSQPLTDSSGDFIGATPTYSQLGGAANAGKGVIFGVLDTGVWPEHPSFADNGNLGTPPATHDGAARACDFGDNPLTPADDPYRCNNKIIGGRTFVDTYQAMHGSSELYIDSARDSEGHGTHTASTAAGDQVASAPVLGVDRGPLHGIAPGAWISVYKVCGEQGCFYSDSMVAVQRAILDGVNVINFSIGGGTDPATDPVELAFLDAYAAGVFVSASAGNSGPGAGTGEHLAPWVTTVAASTQRRQFESTLRLTADGGASASFTGASITGGVAAAAPVVLAKDAAGYADEDCQNPAQAGSLTGKIVVCERGGTARIGEGYNVKAGGAVGMVLYNPTLADVETDNHLLPTTHLAEGAGLLAFLATHTGVTGTLSEVTKASGPGDVMASFSSRGPAGNVIKPDLTAPGVEILAGNTPTPGTNANGPAGEYYMAIAGTSMSSPHVAGSALLIKALHPSWSPGEIKSALMTTATTTVVKEDLTTPADPFDDGAGRVQVAAAGNAGLTFDETAERMLAYGLDPLTAGQLNLASVDVPVMPGRFSTHRVVKNATNSMLTYRFETTSPAGSTISVAQRSITVEPGRKATLDITITSTAPKAQYFGEIRLVPVGASVSLPIQHLPVAFVPQQGDIKVTQSCAPDTIARYATSSCTVTARNVGTVGTTVDLLTATTTDLPVIGVVGATRGAHTASRHNAKLTAAVRGVPSLQEQTTSSYVPLDSINARITAQPIGDEDVLNYHLSKPINFNGLQYSTVGVDSNGYLIVGGGSADDNACCILPIGADPSRPNNVLAPFWTDLDGTGAPGVLVAMVTDGASDYLAVEWRVNAYDTSTLEVFQAFVRLGADAGDKRQNIWFQYKPGAVTDSGLPFVVRAENEVGAVGTQFAAGKVPAHDIDVLSTDPVVAVPVSYTVQVRGVQYGTGIVMTTADTPLVTGTTVVADTIAIRRSGSHSES